jgi:hypothetical protein
MTDEGFPISEGQLQFHLKVAKRKVRVLAQGAGFTLQIKHSDMAYILFTQRGSPRAFKSLTTAATFLKERGVKRFMVILEQRSAADASSGVRAESNVRGKSGAKTTSKRKPRQRSGSLSFDQD